MALGMKVKCTTLAQLGAYPLVNDNSDLKTSCTWKKFTDSDMVLSRALNTQLEKSLETFNLLDFSGQFTVFLLVHLKITPFGWTPPDDVHSLSEEFVIPEIDLEPEPF